MESLGDQHTWAISTNFAFSSFFPFFIFQANIYSGLILLTLVPASPTRIQFSPKKLHVNRYEVPFLSSLVFIPPPPGYFLLVLRGTQGRKPRNSSRAIAG